MPTISLANLRTRARELASMENSTFVTDTELDAWIQHLADEYHDELLTHGMEPWGLSSQTLSGQTASSTLASDVYRVLGVYRTDGGGAPCKLNRLGESLRQFVVPNDRAIDLTIEYLPLAPTVDAVTDFEYFSGGDKFVQHAAAALMLRKEEDEDAATIHDAIAQKELSRAKRMLRNRQAYDGVDFPEATWADDRRYRRGREEDLYYRLEGPLSLTLWRTKTEIY